MGGGQTFRLAHGHVEKRHDHRHALLGNCVVQGCAGGTTVCLPQRFRCALVLRGNCVATEDRGEHGSGGTLVVSEEFDDELGLMSLLMVEAGALGRKEGRQQCHGIGVAVDEQFACGSDAGCFHGAGHAAGGVLVAPFAQVLEGIKPDLEGIAQDDGGLGLQLGVPRRRDRRGGAVGPSAAGRPDGHDRQDDSGHSRHAAGGTGESAHRRLDMGNTRPVPGFRTGLTNRRGVRLRRLWAVLLQHSVGRGIQR